MSSTFCAKLHKGIAFKLQRDSIVNPSPVEQTYADSGVFEGRPVEPLETVDDDALI
ncbi:MAG: hypothetical protein JRL30_20085 [Deltaproteobacteria bacterium]|nr:hypothetical protein [Deltaproteobacteria bacterium]